MSQFQETEELELEPLLEESHLVLRTDDMSEEDRAFYDAKDTEKATVDERPGSAIESFAEPSPEEKRLVRKLDTRILPVACILYLFACG